MLLLYCLFYLEDLCEERKKEIIVYAHYLFFYLILELVLLLLHLLDDLQLRLLQYFDPA